MIAHPGSFLNSSGTLAHSVMLSPLLLDRPDCGRHLKTSANTLSPLPDLFGKFRMIVEEMLLAQTKICMEEENTMRKEAGGNLAEETPSTIMKGQAAPKHSVKLSGDNREPGKWRE